MTSPPSDDRPSVQRRLWDALPTDEGLFVARALRQETVGGVILLGAAMVAVAWANSPWPDTYQAFRDLGVGPLTLEHWAAEGGLAVFFFLAGLELKRELTLGSLSRPADALVPVAAALSGMVVPAAVYLGVNAILGGDLDGWAVPMATDIAFALAVLALVGRSLPPALRAFLLTLAVVDDLGAIIVIATVFTSSIELLPLAGGVLLMGVYAVLQGFRVSTWLVYVPLALGTWWLVYQSGVHATIAGVALGLLTRVRSDSDEDGSPAERLEHRIRPVSSGVAVPFFALMSAGVAIEMGTSLATDSVVLGITAGLVIGKTVGVLGGAWIVTRLTHAELAEDVHWLDILGVAALSGVGFTVSLLLADLALTGTDVDAAKTAVLAGSLIAGFLASVVLRRRNQRHESHRAR